MPQAPQQVRREAPAKINLSLAVGELTSTGYHAVETLFTTLDWSDEVVVERAPAGALELFVDGDAGGVTPEENLVHTAANRFFRYAAGFGGQLGPQGDGTSGGARITLTKRIPAGGGLGGGSSDAAITLLALNELYGDPLAPDVLHEIARELGADVPFFLTGAALAVGRGRGDVLTEIEPLPARPVVLGLPPIHVSTAEAYRRLDDARGSAVPALGHLDLEGSLEWSSVAKLSRNDFEPVVHAWHAELGELFEAFGATGPLLTRMSGSGAAHFAVYETVAEAEEAHAVLGVAFPDVQFEYALTAGARKERAHHPAPGVSSRPIEDPGALPLR